LVRHAAGHHTTRCGEDVDSQTALHPWNIAAPHIHAATRPRHPLDARDHRRIIRRVLQINLDYLLDAFFGDLEIRDVAFFFHDPRDFGFEPRRGYIDFR